MLDAPGRMAGGVKFSCACRSHRRFFLCLFLCICAGLAGAELFLVEHAAEGRHEKYLYVQPCRPVLYVSDVALDALFDARVASVAVHLRPAGDAGAHLMLDHVQRDGLAELLHKMRKLRPRAYEAHIAAQHIP